MDSFRNQWTHDIFQASTPAEKIKVNFKGGRTADYTTQIIDLLKTDPATELIISMETGEILFER